MSGRDRTEKPERDGGRGRIPPPVRTRPVVFGEVLFDQFPNGERVLGGAPFNVAWHMRGFGADPHLVSAVGDDDLGREVLARMEGWGLAAEGIQTDPRHPTGRVMVEVRRGEHRFEIGTDQAWDFVKSGPATDSLPDAVGLLYHGTLALRSERSRRTLERLAKQGMATFVDLNLRDPWTRPDGIRWSLSTARWVKLNEGELSRIAGMRTDSTADCEAAARSLLDRYGLTRVLVTRGARGALTVAGDDVLHARAPDVDDVTDTVGAGDAFSAVVCLGILGNWTAERTLERAVEFAADVCRIRGATTSDPSLYERHLRRWSETGTPLPSGDRPEGLYVMALSVHGLVRGQDIELGRDADTGGQVSYVVDEARALASHPEVASVDLVTRKIPDQRLDPAYTIPVEPLCEGARIVRLPFGPRRYLRKESLWPYLDSLLDELTRYIRRMERIPDLVHGHYADAGYVGSQLAKLLGVPFFFTGHSLGRVKRARLLDAGKDPDAIEERYHLTRRIEAEERALENAAVVIASTRQEVREQYERYDHYRPDDMRVIPPGVDLGRFGPPAPDDPTPPIATELGRFLGDPDRPMVLALARPDERKNFEGLIEAFAGSATLRQRANLVLVAGTRDDISEMDAQSRGVLTDILLLIDRYDLYGVAAYPKTHEPDDIPDLYRMAARTGGVFVNPAFTEPFGLTLLEAAASGVPVVATDDGGPRDILEACENGVLVDATDPSEIAEAIEGALSSERRWRRWSQNGLAGVHEHFSWQSHAERYVSELQRIAGGTRPGGTPHTTRLALIDRILVTDVDDTLTGDDEAVKALFERLYDREGVGFGIATGRGLERALEMIDELGIPIPDVLITATGTQLHYGERLVRDRSWERQIHYRWEPKAVRAALDELPGLEVGAEEEQARHRLRYVMGHDAPAIAAIRRHLRKAGLRTTTIVDHGSRLDVLPVRASPGLAIRFLCFKWNLPPERLLVAGDSGNDADMLAGETLGVVVGNHTVELEDLREQERVYFAEQPHAWGILEGVERYDFLGEIQPDPEPSE